MSYNILSSQLAADHAPELYWHVPPSVLAWDNRRRAIMQELEQLAPDVISLQVRLVCSEFTWLGEGTTVGYLKIIGWLAS